MPLQLPSTAQLASTNRAQLHSPQDRRTQQRSTGERRLGFLLAILAKQSTGVAAEIYAHIVAATREAATRYLEFADILESRGLDGHEGYESSASLLRQLARRESRLTGALADEIPTTTLLRLSPWQHNWIADAPVAAEDCAFIQHLMTPWNALTIALNAKKRVKRVFENLALVSSDSRGHAMAVAMIQEQSEQIRILQAAIAKASPPITFDRDLEQFLRP